MKLGGGDLEGRDEAIIRLVCRRIIDGYRLKASAIHIEPMAVELCIRYRINDALQKAESPPKYLQDDIIRRLKIMSNMNIAETRVPQYGRIQFSVKGKDFDIRVTLIPTSHGESIVLLLLGNE